MYSVISLAGPAILRKHRSHPLRHPSLICTPEHLETSLGRKYLLIISHTLRFHRVIANSRLNALLSFFLGLAWSSR